MGAAFFYHLTLTPLERTLPNLLGKARQAGWRIAVRGTDADRMKWLDEQLWQGAEDVTSSTATSAPSTAIRQAGSLPKSALVPSRTG